MADQVERSMVIVEELQRAIVEELQRVIMEEFLGNH